VPNGAGTLRSESHRNPNVWANWIDSAGDRATSSVIALTRELVI
jgi:hypothetical protein